jgi:hypothetical protein
MADNLTTPLASGSALATDEIAGVHFQRIKVTWGADGAATDASAANPLPVAITTPATLPVSMAAVPTGGSTAALQTTGNTSLATIAAAAGALPTGASTAALQTTGNTSLAAIAATVAAANLGARLTEWTPGTTALPTGVKAVMFNADGTADLTNDDDSTVSGVPVLKMQALPIVPKKVTAMATATKCYLVR